MPLYLKPFPRIHINAFTTPDIYQLESPQTSYLHIFVLLQRLLNQLEKFFHKTIRILLAHAMPFSQRVNQVLYVQFLIHNTGDFLKAGYLNLSFNNVLGL